LLLPSGKTVTIQKATPSFTTPWKSKVGGVFGLTRTETASAKTIGTPNGCGNCRKPTRKLCSIKSVRRETADAQERGTVFCWRDGKYLFAESKRFGHDKFRRPQLEWLEAALGIGLPLDSFLIVEWTL